MAWAVNVSFRLSQEIEQVRNRNHGNSTGTYGQFTPTSKTLMELSGKPMLGHVVERLGYSRLLTETVVATSVNAADKPIAGYVRSLKIGCSSSESDVLSRFVGAARIAGSDLIVRITGDCPLIDPGILDEMIAYHQEQKVEYAGNLAQRSLPRGLDAEVFSIDALLNADLSGVRPRHREHVTPYIYEHPESFSITALRYLVNSAGQIFDYAWIRWMTLHSCRRYTSIFTIPAPS